MEKPAHELPKNWSLENAGDGRLLLNMGPSHPAMHGIVRILLSVEGERVRDADVEIGYLHRGFEKTCENVTYNQVVPYTDRLTCLGAFTGPVNHPDCSVTLPPKEEVYGNIEALIAHFKLTYEGVKPPAGEVCQAVFYHA